MNWPSTLRTRSNSGKTPAGTVTTSQSVSFPRCPDDLASIRHTRVSRSMTYLLVTHVLALCSCMELAGPLRRHSNSPTDQLTQRHTRRLIEYWIWTVTKFGNCRVIFAKTGHRNGSFTPDPAPRDTARHRQQNQTVSRRKRKKSAAKYLKKCKFNLV